MNQPNLEVEKQKSELKAGYYKALTSCPEWEFFVKDMQEQVQAHKNLSVSFAQQNKMDDAKRQAFIVEGIEEALSRPKDVIAYHESIFMKLKQTACALCGSLVHRLKARA